jgi:hypothetical protein
MRDKTPIREQVARRKTTTPAHVKALTLGDLQRSRVERIECECDWCRHEGSIELAPLIAKAGAGAAYRDVAKQFCCSICGWRGVNARPVWPERDNPRRSSHKPTALPSISECKAVLAATKVDPNAQAIEKRAAYVGALRQRWPELSASAALFVVQQLQS